MYNRKWGAFPADSCTAQTPRSAQAWVKSGQRSCLMQPISTNLYWTTQDQMGSQEITVLAPYTGDETPIRRLRSKHQSTSGGVRITYPSSWEGNIEATSNMGTVAVGGLEWRLSDRAGKVWVCSSRQRRAMVRARAMLRSAQYMDR